MNWLLVGAGAIAIVLGVITGPSVATAASDPAPSVKAPLAKDAYAGLACNPFDRKLAKVALNKGIGPEARVASARWELEWRSRAKAPGSTT